MPVDGILLKSVGYELKNKLIEGRVEKIFQPEIDEIILNIRSNGNTYKLLLCSNPSIPRIHLTKYRKENPLVAPNFCMVLRKYLQSAKILNIETFGFERILAIDFETYTELFDKQTKRLVIEIMGKHSNIIFINENNKIIDSIKHVDADISRVREIMPARDYILPPAQNKIEPNKLDIEKLFDKNNLSDKKIESFLLDNIMGVSPFLTRSLCQLSSIDPKISVNALSYTELEKLKEIIKNLTESLNNQKFAP